MPRMALGLSYDGAAWHGWQTQPDGCTVQDRVESALSQFVDRPVHTICAGRTDTGVHGLCQVVHFDIPATVVRHSQSWVRGVNALLPSSIAVQWARGVTEEFHARFSARARTYIYVVHNAPVRSPLIHGKAGWFYYPLDLQSMRQAARHLTGEHDFSSFRSSECQAASPVRTLHALAIEQRGSFFIFTFKANAFLHHMIRNLMGALLRVGQGKEVPEWIDALLVQRDRRLSAPTFSPDGLYLVHVKYPQEFDLPIESPEKIFSAHTGFGGSTD